MTNSINLPTYEQVAQLMSQLQNLGALDDKLNQLSNIISNSNSSLSSKLESLDVKVSSASGAFKLFTSNGTFAVPQGVDTILITAVAGGGGGGSTRGGGGGEWCYKLPVPVSAGSIHAVTIGTSGSAGLSGGVTSFGNLVSLVGGGGGTDQHLGDGGWSKYNSGAKGSSNIGGGAGEPNTHIGSLPYGLNNELIGFGYGTGGNAGTPGKPGMLLIEW